METIETNRSRAYSEVSTDSLSSQLIDLVDIKVNCMYDVVREKLLEFAGKGSTKISIFIPKNKDSKCLSQYHTKLENYYENFTDSYLQNKLIKKFKTEGVRVELGNAVEEYKDKYIDGYHHRIVVSGGYLLRCKWKRDYSKKSCTIL